MNSRLYFLVFLLFIFFYGCNQSEADKRYKATNDSIAKLIKLAANDSLPFKEREKWNDKAFSMILKASNTTKNRESTYEIIINLKHLHRPESYKKVSEVLLANSLSKEDKLGEARAYRFLGNYFFTKKLFDISFTYYFKAEKKYKLTDDMNGYCSVLLNKGIVQYISNDYSGADLSLSKAYSIAKKLKDKNKLYGTLNQLGLLSSKLHKYNDALTYLNLALNVVKDNKIDSNEYPEQVCLANIGLTYLEMDNYRKAIPYFEKALLKKCLKNNAPQLYANIIDDLGTCEMKLHSNKRLPDLFYESLKIRDSIKSNDIAISFVHLSIFYQKIDRLKSILFSQKAIQSAKESKSLYYILLSLSQAIEVDEKNAYKYFVKYEEISDSIQAQERKTRDQFYKIQLETDEITKEKQNAIKQKWLIGSIVTGILIIVILLFVIHRQKSKQKEWQLLKNQQKSNEEIYQLMLDQNSIVKEAREKEKNRIALELHDGIMNRLISTRMNLFVLSKKRDNETIDKCIGYIDEIRQVENEIRNLSHDLDKPIFNEKNSFQSLLKQLIDTLDNGETNYKLHLDEDINWNSISSPIKMHLYRIIQEATHNIQKHAKATNVKIKINVNDQILIVSVADNGIGFDIDKTREGIGIKNMQLRISEIKGFCNIKSVDRKGTSLLLKIPI